MRRGEVVGLRWQDVDLDAGHLSVRHTITAVDDANGGGMKVIEGEPKLGRDDGWTWGRGKRPCVRSWKL